MMQKKIIILTSFFLIMFFTLSEISAASIDMKTEFSQNETLIASISGNFMDRIKAENILLYRNHIYVPFVVEVEKINDDFYVYGQLFEKQKGNYSLVVRDVRYFVFNNLKDEDIVKEFSITNKTADFFINPGFVETDKDFTINVQNLKNKNLNLFAELGNFRDEIRIRNWELKEINFQIPNITEPTLEKAIIKTENTIYEVFVFLIPSDEEKKSKNDDENGEKEEILKDRAMEIIPSKATISLTTETQDSRSFEIANIGQKDLENVTLHLSQELIPYVILQNKTINIATDSSVELWINISSGNEEKNITGEIIAETNDKEIFDTLILSLNFSKDYVPKEDESGSSLIPTCSELGGQICAREERCDGSTRNSRDGVCCLGVCEEIPEERLSQMFGWFLIISTILIGVWFFFKKYQKTEKKLNLLNIAGGKKK